MTLKQVVRVKFVVTILLAMVACSTNQSIEPLSFDKVDARPNLLIFLTDDLTYRDIGPYGNRDVITPHLDDFASQAIKFNHMYVSSAMCAPTRMELYSGLQPVRSGAHPNHSRVYENVRSLPNYLRPLGYKVAILGKRHEAPIKNFSFNHLDGIHHDDGKTKKELDLSLTQKVFAEKQNPWALVVASNQPHTPWTRGDASQYDAKKLTIPDYLQDTKETRKALTHYYAEISYLDNQFGQVLKHLDESKQERDTLIIFLSEQGSNFPFAKWTLYDNGHHSAMLARWHKASESKRESNAIVQYADIVPTLVELAGKDPRVLDLDGRSIVGILNGSKLDHRKYAYGIHTTRGIFAGAESYPIRSITDGRFRLIWNLDYSEKFSNTVVKKKGPNGVLKSWLNSENEQTRRRAEFYIKRPKLELYDQSVDPYNLNNLAENKKYNKIKRRLFAELNSWMKQQGDLGLRTEADALNRKRKGKRAAEKGIPEGGRSLDYVWN